MRPPPITGLPTGAAEPTAERRFADSFALIASLVRRQGAALGDARGLDGDEVRRILEKFEGRVETIASLHRVLGNARQGAPVDVGDYLCDISKAVVSALSGDDRTELRFETGAECLLPPERALLLGVIVVELVTNAVKYAHPSGVAGVIGVSCHRQVAESRPAEILVVVSDDGVGLPEGLDPLRSNQLGFRLVRALADDLQAEISFADSTLGLSVSLRVPTQQEAAVIADKRYRCYLTDADDRIKSVQVITCTDDAEATIRAGELLASSALPIAELWQGARLVGKWGKA